MAKLHPVESDVQHWLQVIGVESLCQWDLLVFLHRHPATLITPQRLARLMGYEKRTIVTTVNSFAAIGLLQLSPESSGARLLRFSVPRDPARREALERLLAITHRPDCLLFARQLQRADSTSWEGTKATRLFLVEAKRVLKMAQHRSQEIRLLVLQRSRQREIDGNGVVHIPGGV